MNTYRVKLRAHSGRIEFNETVRAENVDHAIRLAKDLLRDPSIVVASEVQRV